MKYFILFVTIGVFVTGKSQTKEALTFDPEIPYSQQFIDSIIMDTSIYLDLDGFGKMLESDPSLFGLPHYYGLKSSKVFRKGQYDSVIYYKDLAYSAYNKASIQRPLDEKSLILPYNNAGMVLLMNEQYKAAIDSYQTALTLIEKYPYKWKSFVVGGIADAHYKLGNDSIALTHYEAMTKDSLFMSIPRSEVTTYMYIGSLYADSNMHNSAKAISYYSKGIKASENSDYKSDLHALYYGIGKVYLASQQRDSVLHYFKKGNIAYENFGYGGYKEGPITYNAIKAYLKIQNDSVFEGITDLKKTIKELKTFVPFDNDDKALMEFCYKTLVMGYTLTGNSEKVNTTLEEQIVFLNTYHQDMKEAEIQKLEVAYQTKVKDRSILQLEENREQQDTIILQQRIITFALVGFILLLTVLGSLFWRQRRLKMLYEKETLRQRLLISQMNPHFVGNALNSLSTLIKKNSDKSLEFLLQLADLFRLILTNSREEFVSLKEEVNLLVHYLELQSNFSSYFNYELTIDEDIVPEELLVAPMLVQPFVENAIMHGLMPMEGKGLIVIGISKYSDEKLLRFIIKDNGVGYAKSSSSNTGSTYNSISGEIIKERLDILSKKFKVKSQYLIGDLNPGTQIILSMPLLFDE